MMSGRCESKLWLSYAWCTQKGWSSVRKTKNLVTLNADTSVKGNWVTDNSSSFLFTNYREYMVNTPDVDIWVCFIQYHLGTLEYSHFQPWPCWWLSPNLLQFIDVFLVPGRSKTTESCECWVKWGIIFFLDLLSVLLLIHPCILLAVFAVTAHCWLAFSSQSPRALRAFSTELLPKPSVTSLYCCQGVLYHHPWFGCLRVDMLRPSRSPSESEKYDTA